MTTEEMNIEETYLLACTTNNNENVLTDITKKYTEIVNEFETKPYSRHYYRTAPKFKKNGTGILLSVAEDNNMINRRFMTKIMLTPKQAKELICDLKVCLDEIEGY